jgi:hypothetical protein
MKHTAFYSRKRFTILAVSLLATLVIVGSVARARQGGGDGDILPARSGTPKGRQIPQPPPGPPPSP